MTHSACRRIYLSSFLVSFAEMFGLTWLSVDFSFFSIDFLTNFLRKVPKKADAMSPLTFFSSDNKQTDRCVYP